VSHASWSDLALRLLHTLDDHCTQQPYLNVYALLTSDSQAAVEMSCLLFVVPVLLEPSCALRCALRLSFICIYHSSSTVSALFAIIIAIHQHELSLFLWATITCHYIKHYIVLYIHVSCFVQATQLHKHVTSPTIK